MILPHEVTIVTPVTGHDRRHSETHDYGAAANRVTVRGWMQQSSAEETTGDRDLRISTWRLFTTSTPTLDALARVEWNGDTFEVVGQPNHLNTPAGYHHTETNLRLTEG